MNHLVAAPFGIPAIAAALLLSTSLVCYGDMSNKENTPLIEMFTSSQASVYGVQRSNKVEGVEFTRYEINRIRQFLSELSEGLPKDAVQAKQLVLARFQSMDTTVSQQLENSGKGLAKVMHYGVDRTPAVVFDGQAVVYGVTDVEQAIKHYTQWRESSPR